MKKTKKSDLLKDKDFVELMLKIHQDILNRKPHIKKYHRIRKIHKEVIDSMVQYFENDNYDFENELKKITPSLMKELGDHSIEINFNPDNSNEMLVFYELIVYKNHQDMTSITDEFLEKNKFRREDKIKMLQSMKESYVGLFRLVGTDVDNGYAEIEDVFTNKRFKIIDIRLSTVMAPNDKIYIYNRIITYDDISFGTGINISVKNNKELKKYIKDHKNNSSFVKCLDLYEISKKQKNSKH